MWIKLLLYDVNHWMAGNGKEVRAIFCCRMLQCCNFNIDLKFIQAQHTRSISRLKWEDRVDEWTLSNIQFCWLPVFINVQGLCQRTRTNDQAHPFSVYRYTSNWINLLPFICCALEYSAWLYWSAFSMIQNTAKTKKMFLYRN